MIVRVVCAVLLSGMLMAAACGRDARDPVGNQADEQVFLTRQLYLLNRLSAPEGVDAELWRQLKGALRASIEQRLGTGVVKQALAAPASDAAKPLLRYFVDFSDLQWDFRNPGDYDQNGEVNISDLTPLAVHMGEAVSSVPGSENSIQGVVDGDGNGLITIADITPIGANLGRRITAYNLYASTDTNDYPQSNSEAPAIAPFDSVTVGEFDGNRTTGRVRYSEYPGPLTESTYYWVRPVDETDGTEGTPSLWIFGSDEPPVASVTATPVHGIAPLTVTLDASGSSGSGELHFHWDPEGDATYVNSGTVATWSHTYVTPTTYTVQLKVEDIDTGMIDRTQLTINASGTPNWYRSVLPPYGQDRPLEIPTPRAIACGEHGGRPYALVSYSFGPDYYLGGFVASSPVGDVWDTNEFFVDNVSGTVGALATADVGGMPAYLYAHLGTDRELRYARAVATSPGLHWGVRYNPTSAFATTHSISFKTIAGFPAVAFHYEEADGLAFAVAQNGIGSLWEWWGAGVGVTSGPGASLAEVAGAPAIAYNQPSLNALRYVRSPTLFPQDWQEPVTVVTGACSLYDSLVTLSNGNPLVVYHNRDLFRIMARWSDDLGDTWAATDRFVVGDTTGDPSSVPRTIMIGDIPHTFWYRSDSSSLMHSNATDASGQVWTEPDIVAGFVSSAVLPAPLNLNGLPAVGYATSVGEFKFAVRY